MIRLQTREISTVWICLINSVTCSDKNHLEQSHKHMWIAERTASDPRIFLWGGTPAQSPWPESVTASRFQPQPIWPSAFPAKQRIGWRMRNDHGKKICMAENREENRKWLNTPHSSVLPRICPPSLECGFQSNLWFSTGLQIVHLSRSFLLMIGKQRTLLP